MAQRRTRKPQETFDPLLATWEWLRSRVLREKSEKREKAYKDRLMVFLDQYGDEDENGHKFYFFDEPLVETGLASAPNVSGIKREKRVSQSIDQDRAMKLIEAKGLLDRCTTTIVVINEDAILGANFDGTITDAELSSLYDERESFAFVTVKAK